MSLPHYVPETMYNLPGWSCVVVISGAFDSSGLKSYWNPWCVAGEAEVLETNLGHSCCGAQSASSRSSPCYVFDYHDLEHPIVRSQRYPFLTNTSTSWAEGSWEAWSAIVRVCRWLLLAVPAWFLFSILANQIDQYWHLSILASISDICNICRSSWRPFKKLTWISYGRLYRRSYRRSCRQLIVEPFV